MKPGRSLPRSLAWFCIVVAAPLFLLAAVNLVINTDRPGTYLPLLVLMPFSCFVGVASLRAHRRDGDAAAGHDPETT